MPKTKLHGVIFGLLMSYIMAYGMEVYNIAIKKGVHLMYGSFSNMNNQIFLDALIEATYMRIFVFLFSNLWENRIGQRFMLKHVTPRKDHPYTCQIMRQAAPLTHFIFLQCFRRKRSLCQNKDST